MPRYFIEVAYMGTRYSGFQVQQNANTIQAEIQRALKIFYKHDVELTGSSRTDAGVHALQNFFHFDSNAAIKNSDIYNLNSLLQHDVTIKNILPVSADANCRFDATSRTYCYYISRQKDPFLYDRSYYYPFALNIELLHEYAAEITRYKNFIAFSKKHTQVRNFICNIQSSTWQIDAGLWQYEIKADRFLRGMVKALTGTMLRLAKQNKPVSQLQVIIQSHDCTKADFSPASKGLFLKAITFKPNTLSS